MLENPTPTAPDSAVVVKRYAPPNQRNRSLNRRKSGERFDRNIDGEKSQSSVSRNAPVVDHGEAGVNAFLNESPRPALIGVEGCCRSEASQLLSDRWAAAMNVYNDSSIDLSERPVLYSGSSESAWRNFRCPHQIMSPANNAGTSSGTQMDFLGELRRAMRNANASFNS